jgi:DNA-binding transcriptional regulator GbsR (MarR family)
MQTSVNIIDKYLNETFGLEVTFRAIEDNCTKSLPFFIIESYNLWIGEMSGTKFCLLQKRENVHFTPSQLQKHAFIIEQKLGIKTLVAFDELASYDRYRLIQKKVNFIVANKQIFFPSLLIDLKTTLPLRSKPDKQLIPAAQCLFFYHLLKNSLDQNKFKELAETLSYSNSMVSRAVDNLRNFDLCETAELKEFRLVFKTNKKELWETAKPFLTSPIKRKVYLNKIEIPHIACKSNINALAFYSELNDDNKKYYALSRSEFKKLLLTIDKKNIADQDGEYCLEEWKYNPNLLSQQSIIDPLSLFVIFKNNPDERIQMELKNIIGNLNW